MPEPGVHVGTTDTDTVYSDEYLVSRRIRLWLGYFAILERLCSRIE